MYDKGLLFKIYQEHIQLNTKNSNGIVIQKQATGLKRHFFQTGFTKGQLVHEKVFNIINHQRNANQNHNEISPPTF